MGRTRKEKRETSFVTIRRRERAKGRQVLYLDCYRDGKRTYEFLNLYLVPEKDEASKIRNQNTMTEAMAIRNQREIEMIHHGELQPKTRSKVLLSDWMKMFRDKKEQTGQSKSRAQSVEIVRQHLIDFRGQNVTLEDVDEKFCKQFIVYLSGLSSKGTRKTQRPISASTANQYYQVLVSALNEAQRQKYISNNPTAYLSSDDKKPIKASRSLRTYLTIDEVRQLIDTDNKNMEVKRAFLFACFTGLRISDIKNLTWDNIVKRNGNTYLNIVIQKTQQPFEIKVSNEALRWMPKGGSGHVFSLPHTKSGIGYSLKRWAEAAGLKKDLCFHMSRHTFATMAITLGADLYTVSKLLGHQDISVTQVYADIINEKKDNAVDLANGLFDNNDGEGK